MAKMVRSADDWDVDTMSFERVVVIGTVGLGLIKVGPHYVARGYRSATAEFLRLRDCNLSPNLMHHFANTTCTRPFDIDDTGSTLCKQKKEAVVAF
jgi:hypothetical protein